MKLDVNTVSTNGKTKTPSDLDVITGMLNNLGSTLQIRDDLSTIIDWTYPYDWTRPYDWTTGTKIIVGEGAKISVAVEFTSRIEGDTITFSTDVPGIRPEDVSLEIENKVLKFVGKRHDTGQQIVKSTFVPEVWDVTTANANLECGVLTVKFQKLPEKKPLKLKVNSK